MKVLKFMRDGAEERLNTMATSPAPAITPSPASAPRAVEHPPSRLKPAWQKYGTPLTVKGCGGLRVVLLGRRDDRALSRRGAIAEV